MSEIKLAKETKKESSTDKELEEVLKERKNTRKLTTEEIEFVKIMMPAFAQSNFRLANQTEALITKAIKTARVAVKMLKEEVDEQL